mmetsp:Transcript_3928/g.5300  ORF Transcript_3928/g.5300 Transcript_3928/m.5300 type:complete len:142 (-) Transcript_3928:494-919(-)
MKFKILTLREKLVISILMSSFTLLYLEMYNVLGRNFFEKSLGSAMVIFGYLGMATLYHNVLRNITFSRAGAILGFLFSLLGVQFGVANKIVSQSYLQRFSSNPRIVNIVAPVVYSTYFYLFETFLLKTISQKLFSRRLKRK